MPFKCPIKRKEKQREYSKKHYESNKPACFARISATKKRLRYEFAEFKSRLSCTKCGEADPAALDFHHIVKDPTNKKISKLTNNGAYVQAMLEIQTKCIVLCANCHRKHHSEENKAKIR